MAAAAANRGSRSGSSPRATAASSPCWTARTSCWPSPTSWRSPTSRRRPERDVTGRYDLSLVEGSITTAEDAERIQEIRRRSRALVTIGACATAGRRPGPAQLRRRARVRVGGLRAPRLHPHPCDLDAHRRPRARWTSSCSGCPINKRQLIEVISAFLAGRRPETPAAQRLHRVQAQGQRLRARRPRHAVPGPGDPRRLRRALPVVRPGLLRLLRAQGDAQYSLALSAWLARLGMDRRDLLRIYRNFNANAPDFRAESERHDG